MEGLTKSGGRGGNGRVAVRFRGGGAKRLYRIVDFKRRKWNMPATVERLEYDPNRSAFIALVKYADGELNYILAPPAPEGRRRSGGWRKGRREARQRHASARHAHRHHHPQCGDEAREGRPNGTLRRRIRPAGRPRRRLRPDSPRLGRAADGAGRLHGHRRRGVQPRPHEPEPRQGRAGSPHGLPPARARRRHEPGRPPPRRRRGQDLRRPSPRSPPGASPPRAARPAPTRRRTVSSSAPAMLGRLAKR